MRILDSAQRQQQDWADHARDYLDTVLFVIAGVLACGLVIFVHVVGVCPSRRARYTQLSPQRFARFWRD